MTQEQFMKGIDFQPLYNQIGNHLGIDNLEFEIKYNFKRGTINFWANVDSEKIGVFKNMIKEVIIEGCYNDVNIDKHDNFEYEVDLYCSYKVIASGSLAGNFVGIRAIYLKNDNGEYEWLFLK